MGEEDGGIMPNEMEQVISVPMSIRNIYAGVTFKVDKFKSADPRCLKTSIGNDVVTFDINIADLLVVLQGLLCKNQISEKDLLDKLKVLPDLSTKYSTAHSFLAKHEYFSS